MTEMILDLDWVQPEKQQATFLGFSTITKIKKAHF